MGPRSAPRNRQSFSRKKPTTAAKAQKKLANNKTKTRKVR